MQRKICSKCKDKKEHFEFSKRKRNKDGLRSQCKLCESKTKREAYRTLDVVKKASLLYKLRQHRLLKNKNVVPRIDPRIKLIEKFARIYQPYDEGNIYTEDKIDYFEKLDSGEYRPYLDFDLTKELDIFRNGITKILDS